MAEEELEKLIIDPDSRVCVNCDYWKEEEDDREYFGRCHRYPPQGLESDIIKWRFPLTESLNICGEFQQRLVDKIELEVSDVPLERDNLE